MTSTMYMSTHGLSESAWRLCDSYVLSNNWFEPSGLCIEFSMPSVAPLHGWLGYSAVYARRFSRGNCLNVLAHDASTAMLQWFYSVLLLWKSLD